MELWQHQQQGLDDVRIAEAAGVNAILVTSPTGGGKSRMMEELIKEGHPSVLYTHRTMLRQQLEDGLSRAGIPFGVRAAGTEPKLYCPIQISSIQTEVSRVYRRKRWTLHNAKRVFVDEAHVQGNGFAEQIIRDHATNGATVIGFTATPLGLEHLYKQLVIAGRNSELRKCGAHVPCYTTAPDEPDLSKIGMVNIGEDPAPKLGQDLTDKENSKAIMRPGVLGRIYPWWKALNPEGKPTILFGPDVAGSLWFAQNLFYKEGVPTAHIDADIIWIRGEQMQNNKDNRHRLAEESKSGAVKIVCNRFVLREGIDWPHIYHAIFACVFGSLTSYLQAGGRLLRAHPSMDHVICQDHGGNFWRHGSLNEDRDWQLDYTDRICAEMRANGIRERGEPEPIVCPKCCKPRLSGPKCPCCGYEATRRTRMVVQLDGTLREVEGKIFKPRKIRVTPTTEKEWTSMYFRAKKSKNEMTFNQAYALYFLEHGHYPPRTMPFMPTRETDWYRSVKNIPVSDLTRSEK